MGKDIDKANKAGDKLVNVIMKAAARETASLGFAALIDSMGGFGLATLATSLFSLGCLAEDVEEIAELMEIITEALGSKEEAEDFVKKKKLAAEKAQKDEGKAVTAKRS